MKKNSQSFVNNLIANFKTQQLDSLYCFDGEEDFYINQLEESFEKDILSENANSLNFHLYYGKDAQWQQVLNTCQQASMFGGLQLVLIKEAADFRDLKELEPFLDKIPPTTSLFISHKHKKIDGRSSFLKQIKKHGVYHRFDAIREWELNSWIIDYCASQGMKISQQYADLLGQTLGLNLQKIANELNKVHINIDKGEEITGELIEKYIGISKDYNFSEYAKAIMTKNKTKASRILKYATSNTKALNPTPIIATLFGNFSALYAYYKMAKPSPDVLSKELAINFYLARECKTFAQFYTVEQAKKAIYLLHALSLKDRGIGGQTSIPAMHKEIIGKLLYI